MVIRASELSSEMSKKRPLDLVNVEAVGDLGCPGVVRKNQIVSCVNRS